MMVVEGDIVGDAVRCGNGLRIGPKSDWDSPLSLSKFSCIFESSLSGLVVVVSIVLRLGVIGWVCKSVGQIVFDMLVGGDVGAFEGGIDGFVGNRVGFSVGSGVGTIVGSVDGSDGIFDNTFIGVYDGYVGGDVCGAIDDGIDGS